MWRRIAGTYTYRHATISNTTMEANTTTWPQSGPFVSVRCPRRARGRSRSSNGRRACVNDTPTVAALVGLIEPRNVVLVLQ